MHIPSLEIKGLFRGLYSITIQKVSTVSIRSSCVLLLFKTQYLKQKKKIWKEKVLIAVVYNGKWRPKGDWRSGGSYCH